MSTSYDFDVQDRRIHCDGCEGRITHALSRLDGVTSVEASHQTQRVRVTVQDGGPARETIARKLAAIGFPAAPTLE